MDATNHLFTRILFLHLEALEFAVELTRLFVIFFGFRSTVTLDVMSVKILVVPQTRPPEACHAPFVAFSVSHSTSK